MPDDRPLSEQLLIQALADIGTVSAGIATLTEQNAAILRTQIEERQSRQRIHERIDELEEVVTNVSNKQEYLEKRVDKMEPLVLVHARKDHEWRGVTKSLKGIWILILAMMGAIISHILDWWWSFIHSIK